MSPDAVIAILGELGVTTNAAKFLAFCEIESSFDETATRFEPSLNESSYGLMQLLLSTARDRGFTGTGEDLLDAKTNLDLSIKQLNWIAGYLGSHLDRNVVYLDIVGAWNAGVGNIVAGKRPTNYIEKWSGCWQKWQDYIDRMTKENHVGNPLQ